MIQMLAEKGGWDRPDNKPAKTPKAKAAEQKKAEDEERKQGSARNAQNHGEDKDGASETKTKTGRKRKANEAEHGEAPTLRRSTRLRK